MDNSSLSLIDHGVLTNRWFQQQNPGQHLGDTGNDILHINDTLIAISVNWSNIIQYIRCPAISKDAKTRKKFPLFSQNLEGKRLEHPHDDGV